VDRLLTKNLFPGIVHPSKVTTDSRYLEFFGYPKVLLKFKNNSKLKGDNHATPNNSQRRQWLSIVAPVAYSLSETIATAYLAA
jgi:hypothetical protein